MAGSGHIPNGVQLEEVVKVESRKRILDGLLHLR